MCRYCMFELKDAWWAEAEELLRNVSLFKDYQSLGTYEELADLVSRRDIYKHADELKLQ